mmetsp:Transcript_21763/g.64135  ORF Transcript_21763/g.64135 Transcript_21763/m.64135 type:complete len:330 (-) Transcript_21763:145-1134(-)
MVLVLVLVVLMLMLALPLHVPDQECHLGLELIDLPPQLVHLLPLHSALHLIGPLDVPEEVGPAAEEIFVVKDLLRLARRRREGHVDGLDEIRGVPSDLPKAVEVELPHEGAVLVVLEEARDDVGRETVGVLDHEGRPVGAPARNCIVARVDHSVRVLQKHGNVEGNVGGRSSRGGSDSIIQRRRYGRQWQRARASLLTRRTRLAPLRRAGRHHHLTDVNGPGPGALRRRRRSEGREGRPSVRRREKRSEKRRSSSDAAADAVLRRRRHILLGFLSATAALLRSRRSEDSRQQTTKGWECCRLLGTSGLRAEFRSGLKILFDTIRLCSFL